MTHRRNKVKIPGKEIRLDRDELLVNTADLEGNVIYVNHAFTRTTGYSEAECLGQRGGMLDKNGMPLTIFELLWKSVSEGKDSCAYLAASTRSGDHFWILAHVMPNIQQGKVVGYHTIGRACNPATIEGTILPLYNDLVLAERSGAQDTGTLLDTMLADKGGSYELFVFGLMERD